MERTPGDRASTHLGQVLFLIAALATGPAFGQQTNAQDSRRQNVTVQVGAGTTTETTTGSSGPSSSEPGDAGTATGSAQGSVQGSAEASSPQAITEALCEDYKDPTVHRHCMEKVVE